MHVKWKMLKHVEQLHMAEVLLRTVQQTRHSQVFDLSCSSSSSGNDMMLNKFIISWQIIDVQTSLVFKRFFTYFVISSIPYSASAIRIMTKFICMGPFDLDHLRLKLLPAIIVRPFASSSSSVVLVVVICSSSWTISWIFINIGAWCISIITMFFWVWWIFPPILKHFLSFMSWVTSFIIFTIWLVIIIWIVFVIPFPRCPWLLNIYIWMVLEIIRWDVVKLGDSVSICGLSIISSFSERLASVSWIPFRMVVGASIWLWYICSRNAPSQIIDSVIHACDIARTRAVFIMIVSATTVGVTQWIIFVSSMIPATFRVTGITPSKSGYVVNITRKGTTTICSAGLTIKAGLKTCTWIFTSRKTWSHSLTKFQLKLIYPAKEMGEN